MCANWASKGKVPVYFLVVLLVFHIGIPSQVETPVCLRGMNASQTLARLSPDIVFVHVWPSRKETQTRKHGG